MSFDSTALLYRLSVIIVNKDISSMKAWIIRHISTNCMAEGKSLTWDTDNPLSSDWVQRYLLVYLDKSKTELVFFRLDINDSLAHR